MPIQRSTMDWINDVKKEINEEAQHRRASNPCIFRVPDHVERRVVRRTDGERIDTTYQPIMVVIGPLHHELSKKPRFATIQAYKRHCVRQLLLRQHNQTSASEKLDSCLGWLVEKSVQDQIRERYSEELKLDPQTLARLLFADACFIIHLLLNPDKEVTVMESSRAYTKDKMMHQEKTIDNERDVLAIEEDSASDNIITLEVDSGRGDYRFHGSQLVGIWAWNLVVYDLLKLENQIPYFVMQELYQMLKTDEDKEELSDLVMKLFSRYIKYSPTDLTPRHLEPKNPKTKIHHLLHLLYVTLISAFKPPNGRQKKQKKAPPRIQSLSELENGRQQEQKDVPLRIPSLSELERIGIAVKIKKKATSFLDITYRRRINGVIEIPKFDIYDYTEPLFGNLIAYEQLDPTIESKDAYMTVCAVLTDCLIDTVDDVKLLESKGIFERRLGSPEDVVGVVNRLGKNLHYKIRGSYLEDLFIKVDRDYHNECLNSVATLKRSYCPNRWALIGFIAGILLLILSVLQLVFSVLQYYQPHSP